MRWRDRHQFFSQRYLRRHRWHEWFAWYPVRMKGWVEVRYRDGEDKSVAIPDHWCWGETIKRMRVDDHWRYKYPGVA